MLASISWQHYITATILITATYYFYVALRYYQAEIAGIFRKSHNSSPTNFVFPTGSVDVMGKVKHDAVSIIENENNLLYGDVVADVQEAETNIDLLKESSTVTKINDSEALENDCLKLIEAYQKKDDKDGFIFLVNILITSFERYNPAVNLASLLDWLVEHSNEKLLFTITLSDLKKVD